MCRVGGSPAEKANNLELWCFLYCWHGYSLEKAEMLLFWDAIMPILYRWNVKNQIKLNQVSWYSKNPWHIGILKCFHALKSQKNDISGPSQVRNIWCLLYFFLKIDCVMTMNSALQAEYMGTNWLAAIWPWFYDIRHPEGMTQFPDKDLLIQLKYWRWASLMGQ